MRSAPAVPFLSDESLRSTSKLRKVLPGILTVPRPPPVILSPSFLSLIDKKERKALEGRRVPEASVKKDLVFLQKDEDLEKIKPLGSGAYGQVFRAWSKKRNQDVAIKLLY